MLYFASLVLTVNCYTNFDILYIIKYSNSYNNLTVNRSEAKYNISICLIEHRKRRSREKRKELREREKEREWKNKRKKEEKESRIRKVCIQI